MANGNSYWQPTGNKPIRIYWKLVILWQPAIDTAWQLETMWQPTGNKQLCGNQLATNNIVAGYQWLLLVAVVVIAGCQWLLLVAT